jgi:phosphopantetheinyl transferase
MDGFAKAASALPRWQVQLWLLPRDEGRLREHCRTGLGLLSRAERARLERSANGAIARRFLLGRVLMRHALGAYLDADPASLVIARGPLGKPRLIDPESQDLVFNLSHSRSDWAFALAQGDGLGVDLEPINRSASMARIACAFYSAPERRRLGRPGERAAAEALQLWTLKEAVVKAVGRTVWEGMRGVRLAIEGGHIAWLGPPPEGDETCWSLTLGRLRQDHWFALALKSSAAPLPRLTVSCRVLDSEGSDAAILFQPILTSAAPGVVSGPSSSLSGPAVSTRMTWTFR